MLDFTSIGNTIHDMRVQHGYSQDQLAELLGVSHQAISRWELGLTAPTVDNLAELCDLFDVSFETLLCLNKETVLDEKDIFKGHSRMFVLKQLVGGYKYDVATNFDKFFPQERLLLLRAIKDDKIKVDMQVLASKLTFEELRILTATKDNEGLTFVCRRKK